MLEAADVEPLDVLWLGTANGMEARLVTQRGLPYHAVAAGPIVGMSPVRRALGVLRIVAGSIQAWRLMGRRRPDVVLVTGGYVSVPVALAARLRRVPLVVFLPDVVPGRAVRLVARMATRIAASSSRSLTWLPRGRTVATGYPVRRAVRDADRETARRRLRLPDGMPLLLVLGGSRGARRINEVLVSALADLLERVAVVHVSGELLLEEALAARAALPSPLRDRYHVFPFLADSEMGGALAAADLAVSRSGASVLGEYPARGLPSILLPLGIAGGHQAANSAVLADAGAALVIDDADLTPESLRAAVALVLDSPGRREDMARRARLLDAPGAAHNVWRMVAECAETTAAVPGSAL